MVRTGATLVRACTDHAANHSADCRADRAFNNRAWRRASTDADSRAVLGNDVSVLSTLQQALEA